MSIMWVNTILHITFLLKVWQWYGWNYALVIYGTFTIASHKYHKWAAVVSYDARDLGVMSEYALEEVIP